MDFAYPPEAESFRDEVRTWMSGHLTDGYRALGASSEFGTGDWPVRLAWEREMGQGGWIGLSWPKEFGGRAATVMEELVFAEEYARCGGPTRAGTFGEGLLGPTLIHFGTDAQKDRFLPPILKGEQIWCQGFSEPGAGSDLAGLTTRAHLDGDEWIIDGQKVWTSQAHLSEWIFVLARTDPDKPKHKGISFFLVPLDQAGVDVRPLRDMAGGQHFCEVFFDGARTSEDLIVGSPGDGWAIAMATLGFERGTAFIGQLVRFGNEMDRLIGLARDRGLLASPVIRQRVADLKIGFELMRYGLYRTVTSVLRHGRPGPEASIGKLQWSQWHQQLGELAIEMLGPAGLIPDTTGPVHDVQHGFVFSRAGTIYAGSSQVQRNIIAERVLGLPKEPSA
ncbi:acyl-CoA dehydrogenase family protein [Acidiferrimicrobium sp. IK]|uniref:acyl-CoA dehydrogenase family protein n=1 Tax=Acidiferrimicrobium sp. IK TaxID=2871700 RepID=UPI0021CB7480|nr:acyl-CoA dehydrogenase family protein [Acidiferrimicrobium sp. IK]MCU4185299.1 acyl-CoA dehydrogenase family protein [Acidiferrimicrobium sp. IK]